jgi:hypothetical protein
MRPFGSVRQRACQRGRRYGKSDPLADRGSGVHDADYPALQVHQRAA